MTSDRREAFRAGLGRRRGERRRSRPGAEVLEGRQLLATITVTSAGDADGADGSDTLSLRQAIEIANGSLAVSSLTPTQQALVVGNVSRDPRNTIDFDIPGTGPFTISPATTLPVIDRPTTIDGYSQPGSSPNTNGPGLADNAVLEIGLNGSKLQIGSTAPYGYGSGLISAFDTTIQGLAIDGFNGVAPSTVDSSGAVVTPATIYGGGVVFVGGNDQLQGSFIGAGVTGEIAGGNAGAGVINYTSAGTIGGTTPAARNVISGNGVNIEDAMNTGHFAVQGNFIGTDATGTKSLPSVSADFGQGIISGPDYTVGGTVAGAGNVISGNRVGIQGQGTVVGNLIGTDLTGTKAVGNTDYGIYVGTPPVAGAVPPAGSKVYMDIGFAYANESIVDAGNVISGNGIGIGVQNYKVVNVLPLPHPGEFDPSNMPSGIAETAQIQGNLIGTDISGTRPLGNVVGIQIANFGAATIGGTAAGAGNVISGNVQNGLEADQTTANLLIQGNIIGTSVSAVAQGFTVGNGGDGIFLAGRDNTVGGTVAGAGNIISGNESNGLVISPQPYSYAYNFSRDALFPPAPLPLTGVDLVAGNFIGTDTTRTLSLGNGGNGVLIAGTANTIGGTTAGSGNAIAFNKGAGVAVVNYLDNSVKPPAITAGSGLQNFISGNAIHDNIGLGIDLGEDGITPNNPAGSATGPDHLQPHPVLTGATPAAGGAVVSGALDALPSTPYTIELFSNNNANGVTYYQGQTYLGLTVATTDAAGHASFTFAVPADLTITATASDPEGDTSEFSQAISSTGTTPPPVGPSTTTTLIGPAGASAFGQPVPLAAVVQTTSGQVPTGMVLFGSGGVVLGKAPVNAQGVALIYTDLLPPGADPVSAVYLGDASNAAGLSNYVAVTVTPTQPTVLLAGPSGSTAAGRSVTLDAAVVTDVAGQVPTGTVVFASGGAVLGQARLDRSGHATLVTQAIPGGRNVVSAVYLGDGDYAPSLSNFVGVTITPKGKTVKATAAVSPRRPA